MAWQAHEKLTEREGEKIVCNLITHKKMCRDNKWGEEIRAKRTRMGQLQRQHCNSISSTGSAQKQQQQQLQQQIKPKGRELKKW